MFEDMQAYNSRILLAAGLAVAAALGMASPRVAAQSGSSTFNTIDAAAAGSKASQGTAATAIDNAGDIAGVYFDSSSNEHAFVQPAAGTLTGFDASGSGGKEILTIPIGFDTAGDIAGIYLDASEHVHGFVRPASTGVVTLLDVSGEDTGHMEGTFPLCINGAGEIAGGYSTTSTTSSGTNSFVHGFIRSSGGTITPFDAAPLPTTYGSTNPGTFVVTMNASGEIGGFYIDGAGAEHGFLRDAGGTITTFEAPNAGTGQDQGTIVTGIDAAGDLIGAYTDSNNAIHGFVRNASTKVITAIDATGAGTATYQGTYPDAFDDTGDIFGSFTDANNTVHGFALPVNGTITTYDAPGSGVPEVQSSASRARLDSKLRALARSYGFSLKSRRSNSNSPYIKLKKLLARVGAINADGTGLLNGSGPNPNGTASYGNLLLNAVNSSGEVVGITTDGDYAFHGFLRSVNGTITSLNAPNGGSGFKQGTGPLAINSSGIIVGTYSDANTVLHGFVYDSSALAATTTTITPLPTPNPSVYQEPLTLTASVTSSGGTPPNGENITFMSGATSLGTAALASGSASLTTMALPVGADSITAVYGGDSDFSGSTSTAVSQTVNKASSSTTLKSSLNPSTSGQSVTLTANVSGQFSGVTTGTVTFSNGSLSLGSVSLSNNTATLTTTALPVGTDSITAAYSGDSNFTGSTSSALSQVVDAPPQVALPTFSPAAGTYNAAQTVTISDATSGSTIYYTTNGNTPTTGSTVYSSPIAVSSTETLEAIAAATDYTNSAVASATYTISLPGFGAPSGSQPSSISIHAGATTGNTATISVVGTNGFSGTVNLTCSIAPIAAKDPPTCALSPSSVALSGATVQTSTLTVSSTGATSSLIRPNWRPLGGAALAIIFMFMIPRRRHNWFAMLVLFAIVASAGVLGCGGGGSNGSGGNSGTSTGAYAVTVTGTSGSTTATVATVALTIQ